MQIFEDSGRSEEDMGQRRLMPWFRANMTESAESILQEEEMEQ